MKNVPLLLLLLTFIQTQAQRLNVVLQLGHQDEITYILNSEDESFFLTASRDRSVILWDATSNSQVRTFSGHDGSVNALCFGKDETTFYSATSSGWVYHWETQSGKLLHKWQASDNRILSIAYAPKSNKLITGGYDWVAKIWSLDSLDIVHEVKVDPDKGTGGGVHFSISPDEKYVAIGEDDKKIQLFDLATYKRLYTIRLEDKGSCGGCPTKVQFTSKNTLYAVTDDGPLAKLIRETKDSTYLRIEKKLTEKIEDLVSLHVSKHGAVVVASEKEYQFYKNETSKTLLQKQEYISYAITFKKGLLYANGKELMYNENNHEKGKFSGLLSIKDSTRLDLNKNSMWEYYLATYIERKQPIEISKDEKQLIYSKQGAFVNILDLTSGKIIKRLSGHLKEVESIKLSPDNKFLVSGDVTGKAIVWDMQTMQKKALLNAHLDVIFDIAFANDTLFATTSWDDNIKFWSVNSDESLFRIRLDKVAAYDIEFYKDDIYLIASCLDKTICLFEVDTKTLVKKFDGHSDIIQSLQIDGSELISASWDYKTAIWDIPSGLQTQRVKTPNLKNHCALKVNQKLYTGLETGVINIYNNGKLEHTLQGHNKPISDLKYLKISHRLISAAIDGSIIIWDLKTNKELLSYYKVGHLDWAIVAPTGHFEASNGALPYLHYSHETSTYRLDQFFNQFYQPQLFQHLLSETTIEKLENDQLQRLIESPPPRVLFSSSKGNQSTNSSTETLIIKAIDEGGGISEISLLHNGKRIELDESGLKRGAKKGFELSKIIDVNLVPGLNIFELSASSIGKIESTTQQLKITRNSSEKEATAYVLTIGINSYENKSLNLNYAKADASDFVKLYKNQASSLYQKIEATELYDTQASKANIIKALRDIATKAKPQDVFILYFAGHGSLVNEHFYFIPSNITRLYDEQLLHDSALEAHELQEILLQISALKQVIIVDACHSGGSTEILAARGAREEKAIAHLSRSAGIHILASSESEQFAMEFKELEHGVFTYTVLEALRGAADGSPKDGSISIYELKSYLDTKVPEYSEKYKGSAQYPHTFSHGSNFPLILIAE